MTQQVLILGGSGRFGRNATQAFQAAGWKVHQYNRSTDDLTRAAKGMDVIVEGMNASYEHWQKQVPQLTAQVIAAAKVSNSTVIIPGNVYNFGVDAPERLSQSTPHTARNPLGRVRTQMEAAYRAADVQVIILRAGDFIDTVPTGIWFDRFLVGKLGKGIFTYPGRMDAMHAWAYLPDMARAVVALANKRDELAQFEDVPFSGFSLTGEDMAQALEAVSGQKLTRKRMSYLPLKMLAPFWKLMRHLVEMSYLWNKPHFLDGARFDELVPDFKPTPLHKALKAAL